MSNLPDRMVLDLPSILNKFSKDTRRHRIASLCEYAASFTNPGLSGVDISRLDATDAIRMVKPANVRLYFGVLTKAHAKQSRFVNFRQSILFLATVLADRELIGYSTVEHLHVMKTPRVEVKARTNIWLNREQGQELIGQTKTANALCSAQQVRDTAILLLMLICGLRCEEVTKTRWEDISYSPRIVLRVHGKGSKMRKISIPPAVFDALENWKKYHPIKQGHLFHTLFNNHGQVRVTGKPLGKSGVFSLVKTAGTRIGIPGLAPHDLRRSCARISYLAGASMDQIRELLGHSSIKVTERYINALLRLDNAAPDIFAATFSDFLNDDDDEPLPASDPQQKQAPTIDLLTRTDAAAYLGISAPQFDRLSKKFHLVAATKSTGKTKPFNLYSRTDLDGLKNTYLKGDVA